MRPRKNKTELGELSQSVKRLREALGQTQQQFAQTLGTAITTIARYETGRAPRGRSLARLAEVATEHQLIELKQVFRGALTQELGRWDSTGFILELEPRNDQERLYVSAVLAILRNPQYTQLLPSLNRVLALPAKMSIETFEWAKKSRQAQETAFQMAKEGRTADQIAEQLGVPADEVRELLMWADLAEHLTIEQHQLAEQEATSVK